VQNRYIGDIGDFAKFGLLRALMPDETLGVAWYLYPDESHNSDGRHTAFLQQPNKWRHLDNDLFDGLSKIVSSNQRSVAAIPDARLLASAAFADAPLKSECGTQHRAAFRARWFRDRVLPCLEDSSLVFADPDNGLRADNDFNAQHLADWKRIPISEVRVLSAGRTGIVYHHNSREQGGHEIEIRKWLRIVGPSTIALYWRPVSPRTFFVVNPSDVIRHRIREFLERWTPHFTLYELGRDADHQWRSEPGRPASRPSAPVNPIAKDTAKYICPECGKRFRGNGWLGLDAHWKSRHESIMAYALAKHLVFAGQKPSEVSRNEEQSRLASSPLR